MATDTQLFKLALVGILGSCGLSDAVGEVGKSRRRLYVLTKAADDGAAGDATAETKPGDLVPNSAKVTRVWYLAQGGAVAGDAVDNATIRVSKRDAAGANKTTVASLTTTVANSLATDVAKAFTLSSVAGAVDLSALSTLTWEIAKNGAGVVVTAGRIIVEVEDD